MKAVKYGKKSKKKLIITLVVIALVIGGIFIACGAMVDKAKEAMTAKETMQTGVVEVRDLISSVGATGTVVSLQSKDLTANLPGVEIAEVHVEVGDTVKAGQELVTFDTADIAEDLSMAQRALYQSQQRQELSKADAERTVNDTQRNGDFQIDTAAQNVDITYENYLNAQVDLDKLCGKRSEAQWEWAEAQDEYNAKYYRRMEIELQLLPNLRTELDQLQIAGDPNAAQKAAEIAVLEQELAALEVSIPQAEAVMKQMEAAYDQADSAVTTMERNLNTLYNTYTSAVKSYDNMVAAQASALEAAQSGQKTVEVSANTDQQQKQVNVYTDQLEEGVLKAPFDGVITAIHYDPGDTYAQGPILTIQDCSGYEISAQIGQYDISDIALGQEVLIKTDATREQELKGKVVFIAPTATPVMGMQGMQGTQTAAAADPTYEVKISVETPTDRLRLDMSANLSIIVSEHKSCMTVPYNAVQVAEDGTYFVEVVEADESLTVVPVQVLLESNYYTEVSGQLTDGQVVRVIADGSTNVMDMFEAMATEMGGF